jgi:hypothetical protein
MASYSTNEKTELIYKLRHGIQTRVYTVKELMRLFNLSEHMIYYYLKKGSLDSSKDV